MYFNNPFYASIDLYLKEMQSSLDKDYNFKLTYKSDEKNIKDTVRFRLFDMANDVVNNDNLIVKKINYQGYLEFIYDKRTKLVLINHIPTIEYGKVTIPIFTNDLVICMIKILGKFIPSDEIKINFKNPLEVIAIDKKVEELLPDIKMVKNYNLLNNIRENIRREEAKIRGHILREKEKQDRIWRSEERVMAKKSQVFGIKPEDYKTKEDFERALEQVLIPMWEKKKANIERHLKLNETAYKELMLKADSEFKCIKKYIKDYFYFSKHTYLFPEEVNDYISSNESSKIICLINKYAHSIDSISKKDIDIFLDYFMNCDLSGEKNLVDLYKNTCDNIRDEYEEYHYSGGIRHSEYAGVKLDYQLYNKAFKDKILLKMHKKYFHPIFHLKSTDKMFEKGINLLMQIHALQKKQKYYQNILNNPRKATNIFIQNSTVSGLIMDLPSWFRIEKDNYSAIQENEREIFNLLMIKPGTRQINLDETRIFSTKNGKTFGKTETAILEYLSKPRDYLLISNRFIVTIPSSLEYEEIKKIIDFVSTKAKNVINIVCENQTTAYMVKTIIWSKMKKIVKENGYEYNHAYENGYSYSVCKRIFVNIDPNYYRNFWMTTPDNKTFYHIYDFTSSYQYHRRLKASFTDYLLWPYAIASGQNIHFRVQDDWDCPGLGAIGLDWGYMYRITPDDFENLNYEMIEELIFGSYGNPKYLEEAEKLAKLINEVTKGYPKYPYVYNKEKAIRERRL